MPDFRPLGSALGVVKTFSTEGGIHYRGHHQEITPVFDHVDRLHDQVNHAPKAGNPNEWEHVASIPIAMLVGWLTDNGVQMDQWARNEGGNPYVSVDNYHRDPGVKARFLRYFLSRDFARLHHRHVTSRKVKSDKIVVPAMYRSKPP